MAFEFPVRVYWEDTDAGGIVFYANYLKFFERARTEWLRSLGIGQQALRDTSGGMFVVSETQLKYLAPARLDDVLRVRTTLLEAGRASLTLAQSVVKTSQDTAEQMGEDTLLCQGTIRIGWVDASSMKPGRIPSTVLEALT
jgi:acyl-CoA thioester hydrolase